jgi:ATP-binding cassette subfamily B protein
VLAGLSLTIAAGDTVAIVGASWSGKSTLVQLLGRFYDAVQGSVRVDGRDVRTLDLGSYRRRLGLVPQEPYLSAGTVAEAIAYGRPDATQAKIEAAARAVGAHDAIAALPGGYQHQVGERGRSLSAGQRQLVALARAELVQPDILLLDEATAALDLASEAAVARATAQLTRRRTTLVIAHGSPPPPGLTASWSSTAAGSWRTARTENCSRPVAPMPSCGRPTPTGRSRTPLPRPTER